MQEIPRLAAFISGVVLEVNGGRCNLIGGGPFVIVWSGVIPYVAAQRSRSNPVPQRIPAEREEQQRRAEAPAAGEGRDL